MKHPLFVNHLKDWKTPNNAPLLFCSDRSLISLGAVPLRNISLVRSEKKHFSVRLLSGPILFLTPHPLITASFKACITP